MRILVLGSEGQIGAPLCEHLESKGHEVIRWDMKLSHTHNLTFEESVLELAHRAAAKPIDKVIFLTFNVGGSKYLQNADSKYQYIDDNVSIMRNTFGLLKNLQEVQGAEFLFASSQMANMHHTNYGFLKDLGERYTRSLGGWICRFWNVYGVENCEPDKRHVITDFIDMAEDGAITMRTVGNEQRQFLHTDDCNRAIESWVNGEWDDPTQYYDITSFEWSTIEDVAFTVRRVVNDDAAINYGLDSDQLQGGFKNEPDPYIRKFWQPEISLEDGIRRVYEQSR